MIREGQDDGSIQVLIIEDHVMVAEALQLALGRTPQLVIVGVAPTIARGTALAIERQPDVVLLDSQLSDGSAVDALHTLRASGYSRPVLVLGGHPSYDVVVRTLEAGADGYLLKSQRVGELVDALRAAAAGARPLAPQLVTMLLTRVMRTTAPASSLSRREIDVVRLLAEGLSNEEISARLGLSRNTIRNHVQRVIRRLGAHSKLEAVAIAQREGIIGIPGMMEAS